jgi:hypothetical protein
MSERTRKKRASPNIPELNTALFDTFGKRSGIGGIAVGVLLVLFRELIRKQFFPSLPVSEAYHVLLIIILLTFAIAVAGLVTWASRLRTGRTTAMLLLVFALAMAALGTIVVRADRATSESNDQGPQSLILAGRVVDARANEPINEAKLTVKGHNDESDTTDSIGNFRIELKGDRPSALRLQIEKPGYQTIERTVVPPQESMLIVMR